jgi:hypothetical protein
MKYSLYICFIYLTSGIDLQAHEHLSVTDQYIALAIQGQLQPARALLRDVEQADGGVIFEAERELAARFRQRFIDHSESPAPDSGNALVDALVSAYRVYWRRALLAGGARVDDEETLQRDLAGALRQHSALGTAPLPEALDAELGPAIERQGFHALFSPAPPLRDLLVWRTQETRHFEVELTDLTRSVQVAFLSDFASLGWKEYAALGLATTTGWVEGDTLYCVEWAYEPGTEGFEVSYLKHETRHLADFERFPDLPAVELEYRAKLTELAFASKTLRRLLEDFTGKAAPNPDSPHAEANDRVMRDVYRALHGTELPGGDGVWMTVDVGKVNRVARRLLEKSTRELP